jgi:hypothetical protein
MAAGSRARHLRGRSEDHGLLRLRSAVEAHADGPLWQLTHAGDPAGRDGDRAGGTLRGSPGRHRRPARARSRRGAWSRRRAGRLARARRLRAARERGRCPDHLRACGMEADVRERPIARRLGGTALRLHHGRSLQRRAVLVRKHPHGNELAAALRPADAPGAARHGRPDCRRRRRRWSRTTGQVSCHCGPGAARDQWGRACM